MIAAVHFHHQSQNMQAELSLERALAAADRGDTASAIAALDDLARTGPVRGRALYERARLAQRLNDYNGARQGYLSALAVDGHHIDARAALVELTAAAGALDEARHHLTELEKIAPAGDARVERSRALVAAR